MKFLSSFFTILINVPSLENKVKEIKIFTGAVLEIMSI